MGVSLVLVAALALNGILTPAETVAGFSNPAVGSHLGVNPKPLIWPF